MNALEIIGIVFVGIVGITIMLGVINAFLEDRAKQKCRDTYDIIRFAITMNAEENRKLFRNIMEDSAEKMPDMMKSMYKALQSDTEE